MVQIANVILCMAPMPSAHELEMNRSLFKALGMILLPGIVLAGISIYLLIPPLPPQTSIFGCYRFATSPILRVGPSSMTIGDGSERSSPARIKDIKHRYYVLLDHGFSIRSNGDGRYLIVDDFAKGQDVPVTMTEHHVSLDMFLDGREIRLPKVECPAKRTRYPS